MKHSLVLIFFVISLNLFSQKLQYVSVSLAYSKSEMSDYMEKVLEFDSLSILIQKKVNSILNSQTGDFSKNFNFYYGFTINKEKLLVDFPKKYKKYEGLIPDYLFHFIYCDTTVGISKLELRLAINEQGQIILFKFPHNNNFKSYELMSLDSVFKLTDSITKSKEFYYEDCIYRMQYDTLRNDLIWHISFLHTDTLEGKYTRTDFLEYSLSSKEHKLLEMKYDTMEWIFPIMEHKEEIIPIYNE